jgi:predicted transcriptional regulator
MMSERLRVEHYTAIEFLALPKQGGFTMDQIAEKCGVSRQTIHNWRKNPAFEAELKRQIIRNTQKHLPELTQAMVKHAIEQGNAAMAKLVLQMNDMLTDAVSVDEKLTVAGDVDAMKQRREEFLKRNASKE